MQERGVTGEKLTLGIVAALAVAGVARRGSASASPWQVILDQIEESPVVVGVTQEPSGLVRIEGQGAYMELAPTR